MLTLDAKSFLRNIPHHPGVYQMFNAAQEVLYVGKAKDLKKRLASYFRVTGQNPRALSFLAQVTNITTILTDDESGALLLEYSLIKSLKPRYNILFKDDKSYPYISISSHVYPSLNIYRGIPKERGFYFGPFPSGQVRETLLLLQKIFKVRSCTDAVFKRRSRPCLQYQIHRCTAPCVGYVDAAVYTQQVEFVRMFLSGKNTEVIDIIQQRMLACAQRLEFEQAAYYREQLSQLTTIQKQQGIIQQHGDIDVIALVARDGYVCIDVLMVRSGMVLGNKTFCDVCCDFLTTQEILTSFVMQYYAQQNAILNLPNYVLLNIKLARSEKNSLENSLRQTFITSSSTSASANIRALRILATAGKTHKQWRYLAEKNAQHYLQQKLSITADFAARFAELAATLALSKIPQHVVCFDVSHHGGEATVVSCVAFTKDGAQKNSYRRYNINTKTQKTISPTSTAIAVAIKHNHSQHDVRTMSEENDNTHLSNTQRIITGGDDYAALRVALERYFAAFTVDFSLQKKEQKTEDNQAVSASLKTSNELLTTQMPDVVIIDGGLGQLKIAQEVLTKISEEHADILKKTNSAENNVENSSVLNNLNNLKNIALLAIAKGEERKVGAEKIYFSQHNQCNCNKHNQNKYQNKCNKHGGEHNPHTNTTFVQLKLPAALFMFLLRIRDEAHRFAITSQRNKLRNSRLISSLEKIPGVSKKRRDLLLQHFGGWQEIKAANVTELSKVRSINAGLAQRIYAALHAEHT